MKDRLMVLMEGFVHQKKFSVNLGKTTKNVCLSLNYNGGNSYLFVNEKDFFKFISNDTNVTLQFNFAYAAYLMVFVLLALEKHI